MSAFVVLLHQDHPESSEKLRARIEEQFPKPASYKFAENVYMVTGPKLVDSVTEKLGLNEDDELYAAVLRLNGSYSGRSWRALWDWFTATEESR